MVPNAGAENLRMKEADFENAYLEGILFICYLWDMLQGYYWGGIAFLPGEGKEGNIGQGFANPKPDGVVILWPRSIWELGVYFGDFLSKELHTEIPVCCRIAVGL